MDMDLVFLGTGGSVPTARRSTACLLARVGGDRLLFDCGEGSQRQMQRSTGLVQVDEIYVTHLHADHYLGIPGLLKTYDLNGREHELRVIGPPGLFDLFKALRRIFGRLAYEVDLIELEPGEAVQHDAYEVRSFEVEHRMRAYGYALVEDERPGRFDPREAERLGVAAGPDFKRLQDGKAVEGSAGPVGPDQVMGEARAGRKLVISGDTRSVRDDPGRRARGAAARPRLELRRRGDEPRRRDRPLDRPPGGRARRRGGGRPARPGPHLVPLRRPGGARRGPAGVRACVRPARFRPRRDPVSRAGRAAPDRKRRPGAARRCGGRAAPAEAAGA